MLYIVDFLKAFACILIINFHLDIAFPEKLSFLAIGGDIGNNIFFAISGFTLWSSINRAKFSQIFNWYIKRIKKILPFLVLFYAISFFKGYIICDSILSVLNIFIFPTLFWFTGALLFLYLLLFVTAKICYKSEMLILVLVVAAILYMITRWEGFAESYVVGFMAIVTGYLLRKYCEEENTKLPNNKLVMVYLTILIIVYAVIKIFIMKGFGTIRVLRLCKDLVTIFVAGLLLYWGYCNDIRLKVFSMQYPRIYTYIYTIARITLPAYLVQATCDRWLIRFIVKNIPFPLSYVVSYIAILTIAWGLMKLEVRIEKLVVRLIKKKRSNNEKNNSDICIK